MYARAPGKTDATKIRFWRTGRHLPANRGEALRFAGVLRLDAKETVYFLQACMDKSDVAFETPPGPGEAHYSVYRERTALLEDMLAEYIAAVLPARMFQMDIPFDSLPAYARHLFCVDALSASAFGENVCQEEIARQHISSSNFESEFLRIRKLLGEIPRRTMLRLIFLFGMPYLNRRLIDERLIALGYLPLTEGHTGTGGALVDDLLIGFLRLYGEACCGCDPIACRSWILEQLKNLDQYLAEHKKEEYRFMYFRALFTMAGYGGV